MSRGTAGHKARLYLTGVAVAITDEPTTEVSGTVFQITDADRRILDPDTTVVVETDAGGGAVVDPDEYSVNALFGTLTFASSRTGESITITGAYLPRVLVGLLQNARSEDAYDVADSGGLGDAAGNATPTVRRLRITFTSFDPSRAAVFYEGQQVTEAVLTGDADGTYSLQIDDGDVHEFVADGDTTADIVDGLAAVADAAEDDYTIAGDSTDTITVTGPDDTVFELTMVAPGASSWSVADTQSATEWSLEAIAEQERETVLEYDPLGDGSQVLRVLSILPGVVRDPGGQAGIHTLEYSSLGSDSLIAKGAA